MPPLNDFQALYAFFIVFVRCSAAVLSSPLFGAQNTPVQIRVFTSLALSAALSMVVQAKIGPAPSDLGGMLMALLNEVGADSFLDKKDEGKNKEEGPVGTA